MQNDFKSAKGDRRSKNLLKKAHGVNERSVFSSNYYLFEKLVKVVEDFKSTEFCLNILANIDESLESIEQESIKEIICYGLGNFSKSKSALHQLAALKVICEHCNCSAKLFDPVFETVEIEILERLSFVVLQENDEGKRKIVAEQGTLAFLPHCPKQLTNNFLWANWNISLKNCILIANSFSKILTDNTKRIIATSANYIYKIYPKTKEINLENNYYLGNVFNDISIHIFTQVNVLFFSESLDEEPHYCQDVEFITKCTEAINI